MSNVRNRNDLVRHQGTVIERSKQNARTKQAFREQADIHAIIKKHEATGFWISQAKQEPRYGDFSRASDLTDAVNLVSAAQEEFMTLPARVRAAAGNNPAKLLELLADERSTAELYDLGLELEGPEWDNVRPGDAVALLDKRDGTTPAPTPEAPTTEPTEAPEAPPAQS